MRSLFRKIRQKLFVEQNFRKYLLYATGEIILVVVGILIAFQLNNWSQRRNNEKLELKYYEMIREQLLEDKEAILGEVSYNDNHLNHFQLAKDLILAADDKEVDNLGKIVLEMSNYSDFRRKSNVYQTLVNSGEIKLITNRQLVQTLQELEETYSYINRLEETHLNAILTLVIPEVKSTVQIDPFVVQDTTALYNYKFLNNFSLLIQLMKEKNELYKRGEEKINAAVNIIDNQLQREK